MSTGASKIMGGLCCCFHVQDNDNDNNNNNSSDDANSDSCLCPNCCFLKFMKKHLNPFNRQQVHSTTPANQPAPSHSYAVISNSSDPNRFRDEALLDNERKFRQIAATQVGKAVSKVEPQDESWYGNTLSCPDYEDECPTCLEEYTEENPKKTTECSHEFHLACIYEWMERSENCPVCRKLLLFEEAS